MRVPIVHGVIKRRILVNSRVDPDVMQHEGVYIPRRDSGSLFNPLAGGRLFPGQHHRAKFDVREALCVEGAA